jgi:AbrB family looped-hinge helix DNA binding protein
METVKLSSKGQVVIPKSIREALNYQPGAAFVVSLVGNEIRLRPSTTIKATTVDEVGGMLHRPGQKPMSAAEQNLRIARMIKDQDEATREK